jgi:eukaryotic-like serine/threonine-protein kinase
MPVQDTMINALVDGRYRVIRKLGTGGMANVYLAEDEELGRRVAIKILDDRHCADEQFVERFRREANAAAALSHPNIVSIYDRGATDGTYYIAMEYVEGQTLKEVVRQGVPSVRTAIAYVRQILAALRVAHHRGLVHRDIKPHNIILDAEGRAKVTDFGIARSGASQMTEAGSIIGTAQYLSPEQAKGAPVDERSDLYSLGIVLYELLTGTVPFTGTTPLEIAMKHLSQVPEPPSRRRPDLPPELDKVALRALAKDPDDRYQTAEEMEGDLGRVERGLSVSDETAEAATAVLAGAGIEATAIRTAPTLGPPTRYGPSTYYDYRPPVRRRSLWPWLLALLVLVAAGVGGWYGWEKIQDQLAEAKPVAVPLVEGQVKALAVQNIVDAELRARVVYRPSEEVQVGYVVTQRPAGGAKIAKGNTVTIFVSSGKPKVAVPDVVGHTVDEARDILARRGLSANVFEVYSKEPVGQVVAQDPAPGEKVVKGSSIRINVSQGQKPVGVPSIVGKSFEQAAAVLSGTGFAVSRVDVDSDQPAGTVVSQDPPPGSAQPPGTTVTVSVSKGPQTTAVPDVVGLDRASAVASLQNAGFKVVVQEKDTEDPAEDGTVLSQNPPPGSQVPVSSNVTVVVGKLTNPSSPPPSTSPPPTTTP